MSIRLEKESGGGQMPPRWGWVGHCRKGGEGVSIGAVCVGLLPVSTWFSIPPLQHCPLLPSQRQLVCSRQRSAGLNSAECNAAATHTHTQEGALNSPLQCIALGREHRTEVTVPWSLLCLLQKEHRTSFSMVS